MPNEQVLILDKKDRLQPIAVPGELCIVGSGTSRGYLNQCELTAAKFISAKRSTPHHSSFSTHHSALLYKTGDLARWLFCGNIEFLGRIDRQVKIRGFRVELGEIENRLLSHENIKEAVVDVPVTGDDADLYLCAYIVPTRTGAFEDTLSIFSELRKFLSQTLPDYLIPSFFVQLDRIPLTTNGKIDRKVLPAPGIKAVKDYMAPRDEIEEKLTGIWSEILGLEKKIISINNNFFDLGGHSIKAVILLSKIHKEFSVKLPLTELFRHPTIKELAAFIKKRDLDIFTSINLTEKKEYYQLYSAQKRIYSMQHMETDNTSYNVPLVWILEGELKKRNLERAFGKLIKRHESFRTSFEMREWGPIMRIHDEVNFEINYYKLDEEEIREAIKNFISSFALNKAPLLRVRLTELNKLKHVLMVDIHHIISDGSSYDILKNEFISFYNGKVLPGLKIQYKDFSEWKNKNKELEKLKSQEEFWLKEFDDRAPLLNLPTDYKRPVIKSFAGDHLSFDIEDEILAGLRRIAVQENATLFITLLSIYYIFLYKLSGQEDIVVGTGIDGRHHDDLQQRVGIFLNIVALRNFPVGEKKFIEFLREVKERTLKAFENQDYSFEELVDNVLEHRDTSRNPFFDIGFVFQNKVGQLENFSEVENPGIKIMPHEYEFKVSKVDLTLICVERRSHLSFIFEYSTDLFKKETIQMFVNYFETILTSVLESFDQKIKEIDIIPMDEKLKIISVLKKDKETIQVELDI